VKTIVDQIDLLAISEVVEILKAIRDQGGRLFFIGSGGGAGHASHATCDFRKLGGFEAYCPLDNVSELTARINDEGWDTSLSRYLEGCRIGPLDALFVFSVGGGSEEKKISLNVVGAIQEAKKKGAKVIGIVGKKEGFTARQADACIVVPSVDQLLVTPHTEGMQAVLWHLLISHPILQMHPTKWESITP